MDEVKVKVLESCYAIFQESTHRPGPTTYFFRTHVFRDPGASLDSLIAAWIRRLRLTY